MLSCGYTQEGNIIHQEYGSGPGSPVEKIVQAFVHGDSVSQEDIRAGAAGIAADLGPVLETARTPDESATIILSTLNTEAITQQIKREHLYEKDGIDDLGAAIWEYDSSEEFEQEIEKHLVPILEGLLKELASLSPHLTRDIWMQGRDMGRANIHLLHGLDKTAILKRVGILEGEEERANRINALRHLYGLPGDRSPYIAYSVLQMEDRAVGHSEPDQIQHYRRFDTLQDILDAEQRTPLADVVGLVRDGLRGAAFLVENELRLTDLGPHNIARDSGTGRGMLFDLDSLRLAGAPLMSDHGYYAPEEYTPPERGYDSAGEPVTEGQMVYEFGETIRQIAVRYQESDPSTWNDLIGLAGRMKDTDPNMRPTLQHSAEMLDKFLDPPSTPAERNSEIA